VSILFNHQMGQRLLTALLVGCVLLGVLSDKVLAYSDASVPVVYKVSRGDNLCNIADNFGVSVEQLVRWNNIKDPNHLSIGQDISVHKTYSTDDEIAAIDLDLLARVIYAEARGEDFEGQVAVGAVILNRLKDPKFPKSIRSVIYQPDAFTAINDQQIRLTPNDKARAAAQSALKGVDPTGGALFYYNPSLATDRWIRTRPVIKVIGNHTFSS
jgi:N-acetylmuramoyl-L-alanine amidase